MLLATRCPHCETVFRLQQEQLALHGGLVRCGHCQQVFDAAASLVDEHAAQPEPAVADAAHGDSAVARSADAASTAESGAVEAHATGESAVEARDTGRSAAKVSAAEVSAAQVPTAEVPAAEVPAADAPAAEVPAAEVPAAEVSAAEVPAAEVSAAEAPAPEAAHGEGQHAVSPPRLFVETTHEERPAHANFRPDHWDMWAPWLDGNVDPALQHSVRSVSTEPLVPVSLPDSGVTSGAEPGVVRLTGTPQPSSPVSPATTDASASGALPPISPTHGDEPAASAFAALGAAHDAREPHLAADQPPASPDEEQTAADHAPFSAPRDAHEPRFVTDIHHAPAPATPADDDRAAGRTEREPRFAADAPREPFTAAPDDDDRPHFTVTRETRAPARRGLLGGFLGGLVAAALAVLLVVQLAWWQRESLMIYWPVTQGWFRQLCAPLGCTVAPPRAIDGLRLDATDLRQIDGPRVLELKAPLTNRYRVALAYPSLELTLLDDTNHITVRRVLAPREYVRPGTPIEAGLPAGATQTMIVRLDTNGAPASNFRVQIFYP
ncbi:DUF3426 domain-containing protein [Burkholderia sp. PU8-34]